MDSARDALSVPVLAPTHQRLLAVLPKGSPVEIARLVRADAALAGAVLRAANSAASAPRERIRTVDRAIIRIGTEETRQIAGACMLRSRFGVIAEAGFDEVALWRHLVASALLAEAAIGPNTPAAIAPAAYMAGLLHDAGRLAMASADPERHRHVLAAQAAGAPLVEAERNEFGIDHVELLPHVLGRWGVEAEVVEAATDHHRGAASDLAAAVRAARDTSFALGIGDGAAPAPEPAETLDADAARIVRRAGGREFLLDHLGWIERAIAAGEDRQAS
jgi:HD-like signal output (HDOD) protein